MTLLLSLVTAAQAGSGNSSFTFAPWTGASFVVTEEGEQIQAGVSGPWPRSDTTAFSLDVRVPVSLTSGASSGAYEFDGKIAFTNAEKERKALVQEAEGFLASLSDPNNILASANILCADPSLASSCSPGLILSWLQEQEPETVRALESSLNAAANTSPIIDVPADKSRVLATAAGIGRLAKMYEDMDGTPAEFVTRMRASPLDELAARPLKQPFVEFNLAVSGGFDRFDAYLDAVSTLPEPYADGTISLGLEWYRYHGRSAFGLAAHASGELFNARAADASDPTRMVVTGATVGFDFDVSAAAAVVGPSQIRIPGTDRTKQATFYPVLEGEMTVADFTQDTATSATDSIDLALRVVAGVRPTEPGPGLGLGINASWDVAATPRLLPVVYISGELPDFTARAKSEDKDDAVIARVTPTPTMRPPMPPAVSPTGPGGHP